MFLKRLWSDYGPLISRNILTLINGVVGVIVLLLFLLQEYREGLFIASVLLLNIFIGIIQEIRAKRALLKLQEQIRPFALRRTATGHIRITLEEIQVGDQLLLNLGDQIPTDGHLLSSTGLEVNEALLTGESDALPKQVGDSVISGSIVCAGNAVMVADKLAAASTLPLMTQAISHYAFRLSPIQQSIARFIRLMTGVLLFTAAWIAVKAWLTNLSLARAVKELAAMTGTLVPEGLILATTLLFVYGAVRLYQKNVLLQELPATEGMGRIDYLCVDKTGTLTENTLTLEELLVGPTTSEIPLPTILATYLAATADHTPTGQAMEKAVAESKPLPATQVLPFSSQRKYGAVATATHAWVIGAPDLLRTHFSPADQDWLTATALPYTTAAQRVLCIAQGSGPWPDAALTNWPLRILGLIVIGNPLKKGVREIMQFFLARGTQPIVISGDNPATVLAVARQAGLSAPAALTGPEWQALSPEEKRAQLAHTTVFARVSPADKEDIITLLHERGFTAMVGDGANDALSIKKADLGIAMFEGAPATRQIAQVVLLDSDFASFPLGVKLADTIITTLEMIAAIFFHKVVAGALVFLTINLFGQVYPLLPRNMTVVNYFIIGFPILFWTIFAAQSAPRPAHATQIIKQILRLTAVSGLITAGAMLTVYFGSLARQAGLEANTPVVLTLLINGFWFFTQVPASLGNPLSRSAKTTLLAATGGIIVILGGLLAYPPTAHFFGLTPPTLSDGILLGAVCLVSGTLQWGWLRRGKRKNGGLQT